MDDPPLAPHFPTKRLLHAPGISVITRARAIPAACPRRFNMLPSYLFYTKARQPGAYDALLINL